jgi:hypothetical protein
MLEGWAQLANAAINIKLSPGTATEQLVAAVTTIEQLSAPLFSAFIFAHLDIASADAHHVLEGLIAIKHMSLIVCTCFIYVCFHVCVCVFHIYLNCFFAAVF